MILLGEKILEDSYPVYMDYLYLVVLNNEETQVVRSDIQGNIKKLKVDLEEHYKLDVKEIRSCDIFERARLQEGGK